MDLSSVIEEEGGSSWVEPVVATGTQKKGWKCSLPNKDDDAQKSLLK